MSAIDLSKPPFKPDVEQQREWLTNSQRKLKDAAELARQSVSRASVRLSEADATLRHGGTATGRILILQAIEKLNAALHHIPEGL